MRPKKSSAHISLSCLPFFSHFLSLALLGWLFRNVACSLFHNNFIKSKRKFSEFSMIFLLFFCLSPAWLESQQFNNLLLLRADSVYSY